MKRLNYPLLLTGAICFAAGCAFGVLAGRIGTDALITKVLRALREAVQESDTGEDAHFYATRELEFKEHGSPAERESWEKPKEPHWRPAVKNPFRGQAQDKLMEFLNRPPRGKLGEMRHQATEALLELARNNPLDLALSNISRHGPMHQVCREMVLHGGEEGMSAVLDFILDRSANMEMRAEALHALGALPPQARGLALAGLEELSTQRLPHELQHSLCNALGEISGGAAVGNLLGLLGGEDSMIRPDIVFDTIGRIGKPAHAQQLLGLLSQESWTHDHQTAILRAAARVSKSGDFLLDFISSGEEGLSTRVAARALADSAHWIEMSPERMITTLEGELPPEVRGDLARALVRSGGEENVVKLMELASEEHSSIDADTLGAALAEAGQQELVPAMAELLGEVRNFDTLHHLTRAIVESGGRDGVDSLLSLLEEGKMNGGRLHPLCGSIAEAGAPEDADRLFELLHGIRHPEDARALMKAAVSLAGEEGMDRCVELLDARKGDVRAAAADILGHREASKHLPQLLDVLSREEFGRAQWQLTRAIARAGEDGMAQLEEFFSEDRNEHRKHEILSSLSHLEDTDATPVITRILLEDRHSSIREHAAEILSRNADNDDINSLLEALNRESDPRVKKRINKLLTSVLERQGDTDKK